MVKNANGQVIRAIDNLTIESDEQLCLQKTIANTLGIKEAIVLQYLHSLFWGSRKTIDLIPDEALWIGCSHTQLSMRLCFLSQSTIARILADLERKEVIKSEKLNQANWDHTKYYSINYDALDRLICCKNPQMES